MHVGLVVSNEMQSLDHTISSTNVKAKEERMSCKSIEIENENE